MVAPSRATIYFLLPLNPPPLFSALICDRVDKQTFSDSENGEFHRASPME